MFKSLAVVAALSTISTVAIGADLPRKDKVAAPSPVLASSWTGFYVGGNVGAAWLNTKQYAPEDETTIGSYTGSGVVGGLQVGYDLQNGSMVYGVRAMANLSGAKKSTIWPDFADEKLSSELRSFGMLTGRVGYLLTPQILAYAQGGLAWGNFKYTDVCNTDASNCPYTGSATSTRVGWTLGAGAEYAITKNWSAFAEYDYMQFGNKSVSMTYDDASTYSYNVKHRVHAILTGVNYRF